MGREGLVSISGLGSKNTCHKSMKALHNFGYNYFRPSEAKFKKINVHMVRPDIEKKEEELQQLDLFKTGNSQANLKEQHSPGMEKPVQENGNATVPEMTPAQSQFWDTAESQN